MNAYAKIKHQINQKAIHLPDQGRVIPSAVSLYHPNYRVPEAHNRYSAEKCFKQVFWLIYANRPCQLLQK